MSNAPLLLSIDQGTTSSRALLFSLNGKPLATAQEEFRQIFPQPGWVEHDAEEIWDTTLRVCRDAMKKAESLGEIAAIGITNQRETTVVWDRKTGEPIANAIVWQDRRTADVVANLKEQGHESTVTAKTGLLLDPYFSATKLSWLLDHVEGARSRAERGELAFGTIDSFLLWRFTGGRVHTTDATNASRTMLYNIHENCWDHELLDLFRVPRSILPESVCDCAGKIGVSESSVLGKEFPITGMAGDQQSAAIGQACLESGMTKSTYGTGCFLLMNTGTEAVTSNHRLLTTIACRVKGKTTYAIEGSIFVAGAAVQWLRDGLGIIRSAEETEELAQQVDDNRNVFLVPAFTGLGAPHWDPDARGAIFGLTRDTGPADLARAALESACFQTRDLLDCVKADGLAPTGLRVDGGMVANNWFSADLANICELTVERPECTETTALGAAYLAAVGAGLYGSLDEITAHWNCERRFEPTLDPEVVRKKLARWRWAVDRVKTNGASLRK